MNQATTMCGTTIVSLSLALTGSPLTAGPQHTPDAHEAEIRVAPVETLLLRTDYEVARQQVKLLQSEQESILSGATAEPLDVLARAVIVIERVEAWLKMGDELGRETPDLQPLQRLKLQMLMEIASLETVRDRQEFERARSAVPSASPVMRAARGIEVVESLLKLGQRQIELLQHESPGRQETTQLKKTLEGLQSKLAQIQNGFDMSLDAVPPSPETIQSWSDDAKRLLADADSFVDRITRVVDAALPPQRRDEVPSYAIDLARSALAQCQELIETVAAGSDDTEPDHKLRTLRRQRLALLREEMTRSRLAAQLGVAGENWSRVARVLQCALDAELDLCQTAAERIARLRRHVERMQELEEQVEEAFRAEASDGPNTAEVREVRLVRLEAEIALERELLQPSLER